MAKGRDSDEESISELESEAIKEPQIGANPMEIALAKLAKILMEKSKEG